MTVSTAAGTTRGAHADGRLARALESIDAANGEDPRRVETSDGTAPAELVYGRRMSDTTPTRAALRSRSPRG